MSRHGGAIGTNRRHRRHPVLPKAPKVTKVEERMPVAHLPSADASKVMCGMDRGIKMVVASTPPPGHRQCRMCFVRKAL